MNFSIERDFAFVLGDAARLMRTLADQKAREYGDDTRPVGRPFPARTQ